MEKKYAQALWEMIAGGADPKAAVASIAQALEGHGRAGLISRVGKEFSRLAERRMRRTQSTITVARESDVAFAKAESGVADASVRVDAAQIGGWRLETGERLVDATYKRYLLDIFNRATR